MAGAGYNLFTTGSVLTAAQVNTFLQEQTVMRFANAAARTTALSGVLAEGMMSYLDDTNSVEVYNGSAWVSVSSDQTPLTTKGDLFTYSTTDARLAVGNNGETLVADSSTSTGLRWQGNFAAGKNKIINGDFAINQRLFSTTTTGGFGFDRWDNQLGGGTGTVTYSAQTFTTGAAPVSGYESKNYLRCVTTGQSAAGTYTLLVQKIEDVRTFANQTITISFWAKANSGTPKIAIELTQSFGTGGSPSSLVNTYVGQVTLSTSWARYSTTILVPSISGKTIGTDNNSSLNLNLWISAGSTYDSRTGTLGIQTNTFDIWGVQTEVGNVATAFQTATGTLAGELCAAQRYYYRNAGSNTNGPLSTLGIMRSTTVARIQIPLPVTMRTRPTTLDFANLSLRRTSTDTGYAVTSATLDNSSVNYVTLDCTIGTAITAGDAMVIQGGASTDYWGVSAEL